MSTLAVGTIKSISSAAPVFQNTSGTEKGQLCKAWVNFNGSGSVSIRDHFNVSSITDKAIKEQDYPGQVGVDLGVIKKKSALNMLGIKSPLNKISGPCKAAAKKKFKVWPSAYASGWGVRCTKAGGPSNYGGGKKK